MIFCIFMGHGRERRMRAEDYLPACRGESRRGSATITIIRSRLSEGAGDGEVYGFSLVYSGELLRAG